jgi:hypothetical protein
MPHQTSLTPLARAGKFARRLKMRPTETIRNGNANKKPNLGRAAKSQKLFLTNSEK